MNDSPARSWSRETAHGELGDERRWLAQVELIPPRQEYGLSARAWHDQAQDLGILSEAATIHPFAELVRLGARNREFEPKLRDEEPQRMEIPVRRALAEDLISRSRAAGLFGLSLLELYDEEKTLVGDGA